MQNNIHINDLPSKVKKYVDFTINAAFDNDGVAGAKIASLILLKNKPICIGYNSAKTHTLQSEYGKNPAAICIHAEIDAIRKATYHISPNDFNKATMIVMRSKKNKDWGLARPCVSKCGHSGCQAALKAFGINNVIYSTNENGILEWL